MNPRVVSKHSEIKRTRKRDANSLELKILIENYHESRQEGIKLAHSVFNDVAFIMALLGGVIGSSVLTQSPKILLILPFLLCGIALYMIQKFRINNMITCYLIYLEDELNIRMKKPLFIWNSMLINRHISASRESAWGNILLIILILVVSLIYFSFVYTPYIINLDYFVVHTQMNVVYWLSNGLLFLICLIGLIAALSISKKLSSYKISALIKAKDSH